MKLSFPKSPRIAIVGAGALGAYYGSRLAQSGLDVHFLLRSDYDVIRKNGWTIRSVDGDFNLPAETLHVYNDPAKMPTVDLVIVTLKTTANDQFEPLIARLLFKDTAILTMQNGLGNEERLAELFGPERILGGMAFVCINRLSGGVIHHSDHGFITLGEFVGGASDRANLIAGLLAQSKVRCKVLDDLRKGRWEKLVWNIPFNGLGAVMDRDTESLLKTSEGVALVRTLMEEVLAGAKSAGVELDPAIVDAQIARTRSMGPYQTSMQVDRRQGRPIEAEAILGRPLKMANSNGVNLPALSVLYRMAVSL